MITFYDQPFLSQNNVSRKIFHLGLDSVFLCWKIFYDMDLFICKIFYNFTEFKTSDKLSNELQNVSNCVRT